MIKTFSELQEAVFKGQKKIEIGNSIVCTHSIILPKGSALSGKGEDDTKVLLTFPNGDGIGVTENNSVTDLAIMTRENQRAIYTTLSSEDLGSFEFKNLTLTGQFGFVARKGVKKAKIVADTIDIIASDSRARIEQPQKYGVNALQGAFTVYNFTVEKSSEISLAAENITIGRPLAPVKGSGIFICGGGDEGGWVKLEKLETKAVYSNGNIPENVADIITAAVFIVNGVKAKEVVHNGEIATYGTNDMVLDAWGEVENWTANAPVISYGPSSIGFVNFGTVKNFAVNAPLKTYGAGSRGYNQYDGTAERLSFESIETFGDGSIGVQLSKKIGEMTVKKSIVTHGATGNSLVKGQNVELPAMALSVKEGGAAGKIKIGENIETNGKEITAYHIEFGGKVKSISVGGKIVAKGSGAKPVEIHGESASVEGFVGE